jgi:hypothetical protein
MSVKCKILISFGFLGVEPDLDSVIGGPGLMLMEKLKI